MKVQIAKWGNSAAVRLPKALVDELGLGPGAELDVVVEGGAFRLSPTRQRPSLAALVIEMKRLGGPGYDYGQHDWPDDGADWPVYDAPDE
jgi:antitoxin MazE